ncbi:MAG: ABC transporter permease [Acidobacteriota bacterium]|nr:ABC transporter permease [Acidobacteriota bacterium]
MLSDLRYAFRSLAKNPGLTAVIVLSLGIGIGANSAIFSVVNALMLKPLPYPHPERLAVLWLRSPGLGIMQDWPSPGEYLDIRAENHTFEDIAISQGGGMTLTGREQPEHIEVLRTSSSLFKILGARPQLGRLLLKGEDAPGKPPVAILSDAAWRKYFNADRNVLNRTVTLNGNSFTIAGVLSPDFVMNHEIMQTIAGIEKMEIYLPLPLAPDAQTKQRGDENYNLTGLLKPGVSVAQAKADVRVIAERMKQKDKRSPTFTVDVVSLSDQVVGDVRAAILVLFASVGLVLAIACANVANLLLSRAAAREKEMAIRTALGAKWTRIARQLLTESLVLGVCGGAAGLLIAFTALKVVHTMNPGNIPRLETIGIDPAVLAFTFGVSILTSVLFCAAPVTRAIRPDVNASLKSGGRNTQSDGGFSGARHRLRALLVVSELAISLMLLLGAALLIRSFGRLEEVKPGFNPENVISMQLGRTPNPQFTGKDSGKARQRDYQRVYAHVAELRGIRLVGGAQVLPFTPSIGWGGISIEGYNPPPDQGELQVDLRGVTPRYFEAMQVPLLQGRAFEDRDTEDNAPRTAIVDDKLARRFFPRGAVGKQIWFNPKEKYTIAGVVDIVKQYGLGADTKMVAYFPVLGTPGYLVARTSQAPEKMASAIVTAVHQVDPFIPVYDIRTMPERVRDSLARARFSMTMMTAFALFAMILAAVGVYGALSYMVTQGMHDIGVRIALGATRRDILAMVVKRGMELAGTGIVLGIAGAYALARAMTALLFGITPHDPAAFTAASLFLAAVALTACAIPARRATGIDPMKALRDE